MNEAPNFLSDRVGDDRFPSRDFMRTEREKLLRKRRLSNLCSKRIEQSQSDHGSIKTLTKIKEFRTLGVFCDGVLISAEGCRYPIHRVVLASNSEYFQAAFRAEWSTKDFSTQVHFPASIVESILSFCYSGKCNITERNVEQLLQAADQYAIINLVEVCSKFIKDNLTISNAYGIFRFSSAHGFKALAKEAHNLILKDFVNFVSSSNEFRDMLVDDLESILGNKYLNLPSETLAFSAMSEWIQANLAERKEFADRLWTSIRFKLISYDYFKTHVETAPFILNISAYNLQKALNDVTAVHNILDLSCLARVPYYVIFAIGGRDNTIPLIETYDIRADIWVTMNMTNDIECSLFGIVSVDNLIYLVGGKSDGHTLNSVHCFNPSTKMWQEKACMHSPRYFASYVAVNDTIYAIGGVYGSNRIHLVERYSAVENQWYKVTPMKRRRSLAGAVTVGNKIFVVGGYNRQRCLDQAEYYCPDTDKWHALPSLNIRRSGLSLVNYKDHIYAVGGYDGFEHLKSVERLNIFNPTEWYLDVPNMLTGRSNFACSVVEGKVFVMGGCNAEMDEIQDCECFDGENWHRISGMNYSRSQFSACVCEGLENSAEYSASSSCSPHPPE